MYRISAASRRVEKEIADLPGTIRIRVVQAIRQLADNPRPPGARKLSGEMRGAWRVRIGNYRVIYDIDDDTRLVIVLTVAHRREAYR